MTRFTLFVAFAFGLLGCAQQPSAESPLPAVAVQNSATDASSSSVAEHSPDLGDKAVAYAVAPDTPALTPAERFGVAPMPHTLPALIANPDGVAKVKYTLPTILPAKLANVKLGIPAERVPPDLGNGASAVPAKPTLPVASGITERSRDANLPPRMPTLGRPPADRVSLDDPTSELGNAAVANPFVKMPLAPATFLKVALPDPFEFGDQVKPNVPPAVEPGLTPVQVNPPRVK